LTRRRGLDPDRQFLAATWMDRKVIIASPKVQVPYTMLMGQSITTIG
jgi:hypothetical protein